MLFKETLRIEPPARVTSPLTLLKDETFGKLKLKKGDTISIDTHHMHHNPNEWQRHTEFLPDRFDSASPLYLTPSGKKRCAYSFMPFFSGKRSCFGQTFSAYTSRIVLNMLFYKFNFDFVDDKWKTERPMFNVAQNIDIPVHVRVTPRN